MCTICKTASPELLPWAGERACQGCFDAQLDLMAKAIQGAGAGAFLSFGRPVFDTAEVRS